MIKWCSYCQKYLGAVRPFDDFRISHGICQPCLAAKKILDKDAIKLIRPIANFYLQVANTDGREKGPAELLDEGLRLGLDPWDLLVGINQPALYDMGYKWANGKASVSDEHALTAACTEILALIKARARDFLPVHQPNHPEVLLVNAEGNSHSIGIQHVEFFLLTRSVPVQTILTALPTSDVIQNIQTMRPRKVGISCALPSQIDSARRTAEAIAALPEGERPAVFVGGFAMLEINEIPDWPFRHCMTAMDLLDPSEDAVT